MRVGTRVQCPLCQGQGRFDDVECPTCRTTGLVPASLYDKTEPRPARASSEPAPTTCPVRGSEGATNPDDVPQWVVYGAVFVAGWAAAPYLTALLERIA